MTREEAIEVLKDLWKYEHSKFSEKYIREALEMAIKVLEQEPCEDAISRQAVLSKIKEVCFSKGWVQFRIDYGSNGQRDFLINHIEQLPSVTPQQRTGRWVDDEFGSKCSCCGIYTHLDKFDRPIKFKCCSMCGAKMEVEE